MTISSIRLRVATRTKPTTCHACGDVIPVTKSVLVSDAYLLDARERRVFAHMHYHVGCWYLCGELECGYGYSEKRGNYAYTGYWFRGPAIPGILPNEVCAAGKRSLEELERWGEFPGDEQRRILRWTRLKKPKADWPLDLRYWNEEQQKRLHFDTLRSELDEKGYIWESCRPVETRAFDEQDSDWPNLSRYELWLPRRVIPNYGHAYNRRSTIDW